MGLWSDWWGLLGSGNTAYPGLSSRAPDPRYPRSSHREWGLSRDQMVDCTEHRFPRPQLPRILSPSFPIALGVPILSEATGWPGGHMTPAVWS